MLIDLHIHTSATPGHASWEPQALVQAARTAGLGLIACTDHNTTGSVPALLAAAAEAGIQAISGVEIDSAMNGKLWHTLIYGADPQAPELLALCTAVFERNAADAARLQTRLQSAGYALSGLDQLGRQPNVAEVATALAQQHRLPRRQRGEDDEAAGMRFVLTELRDAYRPLEVSEVIAVAHKLGAVALLAHPGRSKGVYAIPADDDDIDVLVEAGLDGIEVHYPTHSQEQIELYGILAEKYGLLVSAGSDSHHPSQPLGRYEASLAADLLLRLGIQI